MAEAHENPDEIQIKNAIERCERVIAEELKDEPDEFKPGSADYDTMTAIRDVFAFTIGSEADLVPAELRGLIARFADGFVRGDDEMTARDEEWEREQEERERIRKEHEAREARLRNATQFAVQIDREDGVTVLVGPYDYRFQADQASFYFLGCATNTAGAAGAQVTVLPYDENQEHRPGLFPEYTWVLAELIGEEGTDRESGDFPDLYARFAAHLGERASQLWRDACAMIDAPADAAV